MRISQIEIHGVKDKGTEAVIVPDHDADFFGLFGLVEGEVNDFYLPIGDASSRENAELVLELLDNKSKGQPPK